MKSSKFICLLLLFTCSLSAQLRLRVEGNAKITGQLDLSSPGTNMFIGVDTGESTTTGTANTFIGQAAGAFNTEGESNTFIGLLSGFSNTSGKENTFVGLATGLSNLTGHSNTFVGMNAGRTSTSGSNNTFLGNDAGRNTNGSSAGWNTFVGVNAGLSNTTGQNNIFIGYAAGSGNTTGIGNTIVGNNTGNHLGFVSSFNTLLGNQAGSYITSGDRNTFLGTSAGYNNSEGQHNTFVGLSAGGNNTSGSFNTFVGSGAGDNNITGSNLTALGNNVNASLVASGLIDNAFALGNNSIILKSHSGVLGNIGIQQIGGYVNWGTASDGRMKADIREDVKGLDFVLQLRAVTYRMDTQKLDKLLRDGTDDKEQGLPGEVHDAAKRASVTQINSYQKALEEKSKIRYTGFIAQEVEKAANVSSFEFSGLIKPTHDKDHYSLRYAEFVVPLVKAVQEQQQIIDHLQTEVTELKYLVDQLLAQRQNEAEDSHYDLNLTQVPMLSQNQPNPFHQNTSVDYFIPGNVQQAAIQIHSVDGKILATIKLKETGKGRVNINAQTYPAGTYFYSLLLDGQVFETRRMVLTP